MLKDIEIHMYVCSYLLIIVSWIWKNILIPAASSIPQDAFSFRDSVPRQDTLAVHFDEITVL